MLFDKKPQPVVRQSQQQNQQAQRQVPPSQSVPRPIQRPVLPNQPAPRPDPRQVLTGQPASRPVPPPVAPPQPRAPEVAGGRRETSTVLFGDELRKNAPSMNIPDPILYLKGRDGNGNRVHIPMGRDLLSRHIMLLGGIGTGKTNAFFQMLEQITATLTEDDVMIVFDTKGDFYQQFYRPGDVVISNDATAIGPDGRVNYWNIFNEVSSGQHQYESVLEISKGLFAEAVERTNQIFFPSAARDIFMGCMLHFLRSVKPQLRTNKNLIEFLNYHTTAEIRAVLESHSDLRAMANYISKDDSAQTQGVMSELQQVVRNIFVGNFAKTGNLGLRKMVRQKGGRIVFIEYDLSLGDMLTPIYTLMFDMAIKQALGRSRSAGNVYFITDEFRLLPHLEHIDDAVNFGRSLGIRFMIGIQNVQQIFENYGEERARSIMSGFLTSFNFRVNDAKSREYIQQAFGKNQKLEAYVPVVQSRGMVEQQREANVVEDWDVTNLHIGEAIIGFPGQEPFTLQFDKWEERPKQ